MARRASRLLRGALAVLAVGLWCSAIALLVALAAYGREVAKEQRQLDLQATREPIPPRFASVEGMELGSPLRGARPWLPLSQMGSLLPLAVVGAEDSRFFLHGGVDPIGVLRAALANLRHDGPREGGSTLTQQLAKQQVGSERTIARKLRELVVARRAEHTLSKPAILEAYLNRVYLGAGATGAPAAAEIYFCKQPSQLTLAEAATLAAIIPAPSRFAPTDHAAAALERRNRLLRRLQELGFAGATEVTVALAEPLALCDHAAPWGDGGLLQVARASAAQGATGDLVLSHSAARQQQALAALQTGVTALAIRQRGATIGIVAPGREAEFDSRARQQPGGTRFARLEVDASGKRLWRGADNASAIEAALPNAPAGTAVALDAAGQLFAPPTAEGAVLVLDRATAVPLAQVGSVTPKTEAFDRTRQACRQPGSTFKPLVFELAMESGLTPASLLSDGPAAFELGVDEVWSPRNADGQFGGAVTVWKALAASRNLPFVALGRQLGLPRIARQAARFGIASPMAAVESLPLGGSCLTPAELAGVYGAIARGGLLLPQPSPRSELWMSLEERIAAVAARPSATPVGEPVAIFQTASALREVVEAGTAHAIATARIAAAGKTGTSSLYDAWFAGFTTDEVAVVWVGSDKNDRPLGQGERGGTVALPIWLASVRGDATPERLLPDEPAELLHVSVDPWSGQPSDSGRSMPFRAGTEPRLLRESEAGRMLDGIRSIERDF